MKKIKFEDLKIGMQVQDEDHNIGTIIKCDNIHNIEVEFENGYGLHCLVEGCYDTHVYDNEEFKINQYFPLYYL